VVEVLKIFHIFLHQITPEAIIRMGIFVWAVRSQGLEPSAKCFCNMHELLYETKATSKEQYHNNFGCYGFITRPNASYPVPTYWKRWPGAWMEELFNVKNDLIKREDIKEIIQCPIWSRFGLRRPKVAIESDVKACQKAFSTVCAFIGTRDIIQEHIVFKVAIESDSYDVESGGEDSEDRPWRPSHSVFGKSSIKQSHLDNMRGRYFWDMSTVRADDGERTVPTPEENEVVIFRSFLKLGFGFP
jgi:hypothetical protein